LDEKDPENLIRVLEIICPSSDSSQSSCPSRKDSGQAIIPQRFRGRHGGTLLWDLDYYQCLKEYFYSIIEPGKHTNKFHM